MQYLALCRVLIGKIYLTSNAFDKVDDREAEKVAGFDSIYSSEVEEYKLLSNSYVLPEFLVVYRFRSKPPNVVSMTDKYLPPNLQVCSVPF